MTSAEAAERGAGGGLTIGQGAALTIGAVLGTGVITLPALAADLAGPASLLAWLARPLCRCRWPSPSHALGALRLGGVSTYARRAFGPRVAAMVGWCFYAAVPIRHSAASMMAGQYVADVIGGGRVTVLNRRRC
ncbi:MAG: hypothetical protein R2703_00215 [Micropruina glycogenica]